VRGGRRSCIQLSFSMWKKKKFINALLNQARWPHRQQPDDLPYQWARMEHLSRGQLHECVTRSLKWSPPDLLLLPSTLVLLPTSSSHPRHPVPHHPDHAPKKKSARPPPPPRVMHARSCPCPADVCLTYSVPPTPSLGLLRLSSGLIHAGRAWIRALALRRSP
jgi:hypothetical protein